MLCIVLLLGALPAFAKGPPTQKHSNIDTRNITSLLESRQLITPEVAPSLLYNDPFRKSVHHYTPLDNDEETSVYERGPGRELEFQNEFLDGKERFEIIQITSPSLAKRQVGGDFEARKKMFESGNGGRNEGTGSSSGGSGKPAADVPATGKVSGLKGQLESSNGASSAGSSAKPAADLPSQGKVGNLKGQFEGDSGSISTPGKPAAEAPSPGKVGNLKNQFEGESSSNPGKPAAPDPGQGTVSNLKGQFENGVGSNSNPTSSGKTAEMPKPGTVQDLTNKFENPAVSEINPTPIDPVREGIVEDGKNVLENPPTNDAGPNSVDLNKPKTVQELKDQFENPATGDSIPSSVDKSNPGTVQELKDKFEKSGTGHTAPKPVDVNNQGTVQGLKDQFENPTTGHVSSKPVDLNNQGTVQGLKGQLDAPADGGPFAAPAPKPGQPSNPVPKEPSIADQLKEFSAVDANGKPIDRPVSPSSGIPAPKKGLHDKANSWEKLDGKDARKRPDATYELDDPALNPRPPIDPIFKDAGLNIGDYSKDIEAVRKSNPEIKKMDKELNNLLQDMLKNRNLVKDIDAQLAKIKETQAKRDAQENEMLQRKNVLDAMRKRLVDEQAKNGLQDAYRTFGESLERIQSTLANLKAWKKTKENDLAEAKLLEKSMKEDQSSRQEASKALQKENANVRGWKKPPQVPPIVRAAKVDGGRVSSIDTHVPPPNMPLPAPLPGSVFPVDHPMRVALDDIRIKGKLTQETADNLVASGWGISPAAEQFLKDNNIPYDNMVIAKGAISGFASMAHLAPAGVLAATPEVLELAALAGSPEIMAAIGTGMAAPEIATVASAALPAIGGVAGAAGTVGTVGTAGVLTEEGVKQAVTAAQVVSIGGKDVFKLSRTPLALIAAGTTTGASLGFAGGLLAGIFAKKRTKDDVKNDVKNAVSTVLSTVTKVDSKTTMDHITEILGGKTITVEKTSASQPTTTAVSKSKTEKSGQSMTKSSTTLKTTSSSSIISSQSMTKSSSALKTTSWNSAKASQSMAKSSFSSSSLKTSPSSIKSTGVPSTSSVPSSTVTANPKPSGKGPIVLPPVILPLPPSTVSTNVTNSTSSGDNSQTVILPFDSILNITEPVGQAGNSTRPVVLSPGLELNATETVGRGVSTQPFVLPPNPKLDIAGNFEQEDTPVFSSPDLTLNGTSLESIPPNAKIDVTISAGQDSTTGPVVLPPGLEHNTTEPVGKHEIDTLPVVQSPCPATNATTWMESCRDSPVLVPSVELGSKTEEPPKKKTHTVTIPRTRPTKSMSKVTNSNYPVLLDIITKSHDKAASATKSKTMPAPTAVVVMTTFVTSVRPITTLLPI
ncbi:uncharacterized protein RAG0_13816 [Rhynchosporium agropyri]|uniref:Uncharacterized protein n=1 Tax=Rhynchosporium agropyri TaxID=914238 RepID=A0A1E1LEC7_9HELO|nr:uncharacterized protein RAG0_13816 [Rhynchosporium agropyri]